jgi:hypothetical protein
LFGQGIRAIVEANGHSVVSVSPWSEDTLAQVKELHINTIILCGDTGMPPALEPNPWKSEPGVRVILLTLDSNVIRIGDSHQIVAHNVQALLTASDTDLVVRE